MGAPPPNPQGNKKKVTAQVVSCLVCDVPTHGVWGLGAPAGAGQRPAAFSRLGSRERSGREPSRFFPFPLPWTKSMGLNSFKRPGPKTRESYGGSAPKPPGKIKRFKPALLFACREQQGGKEKGKNGGCSPPNPQPGTMSLDPISLAHRMLDTTQPGQLQITCNKLHRRLWGTADFGSRKTLR